MHVLVSVVSSFREDDFVVWCNIRNSNIMCEHPSSNADYLTPFEYVSIQIDCSFGTHRILGICSSIAKARICLHIISLKITSPMVVFSMGSCFTKLLTIYSIHQCINQRV